MNEQDVPWDDLRLILAIASEGSLSGAARRLKVSHATVFRRLAMVEERLGVRLFERFRTGYVVTPAGDDIANVARRIETEVQDVRRRIAGQDLRPSGTVRVTTTDTLLAGLLAPVFADFQRAYPDIALEVVVSNQLFNLTRREADVAIRPTMTPPENLVGRKIGIITQAIYCQKNDKSGEAEEGKGRPAWVGPDDRLGYQVLERWMDEQGVAAQCLYRVDTVMGMLAAVRAGAGRAVLPCYLADADPGLSRVSKEIPALATELWLLTHPDLRRVARIRAFMDYIVKARATWPLV